MQPIGFLHSCYKDRFGTPRQPLLVEESWSKLVIDPVFQPEEALLGLDGFSHIWLIFLFHKNTNLRYHAKVHPPRLQGRSIGLFATRSPHRPNPVGLSLVRLESIRGNEVIVRGADLIDGTPILDIKPYLPEVESVREARSGWTEGAATASLQVEFSPEIEMQISNWAQRIGESHLRNIIIESLELDPRPLVYREDGGEKYRSQHAVRLFDGDIHFTVQDEQRVIVSEIRF